MHAIRRAANFSRSKLRHLLSDRDSISDRGSSSVPGMYCSRSNPRTAPHFPSVLRITTEINRLEPVFGGFGSSPSQFTKRIRGFDNKYRCDSRHHFQGHRNCFLRSRAAVSPREPIALVPKQGRATAVGPPTCGHNGSPATSHLKTFPSCASLSDLAPQ
jgi:hypothetical protein